MTAAFFSTIPHLRLHNQQLIDAQLAKVEDVVHWLSAVQAQDFAAAKWALALRVPSATEAALAHAFNEGKIRRTRLRPTWYFVSPRTFAG